MTNLSDFRDPAALLRSLVQAWGVPGTHKGSFFTVTDAAWLYGWHMGHLNLLFTLMGTVGNGCGGNGFILPSPRQIISVPKFPKITLGCLIGRVLFSDEDTVITPSEHQLSSKRWRMSFFPTRQRFAGGGRSSCHGMWCFINVRDVNASKKKSLLMSMGLLSHQLQILLSLLM